MDTLEVELIHLYPKENSKVHKTDKYEVIYNENPIPILRRGQKFSMAMRFLNRDYNPKEDRVKVLFNYGPKPNPIKNTQGIVKVDLKKKTLTPDDKYWTGTVLDHSNSTLTLEVISPPNIPVGLWELFVETSTTSSKQPVSFPYENDLYFLCNPWNCHDLVYMPEERFLDEYVLTDVGKIWVGPLGSCKGREWVFGQFDACVLPAITVMMENSRMDYSSRGDPIKLTRMFSKMVNSNDDDGILVGRWDGIYEDGTAPSAWTGSVPILQEYLETELPVCYGQCWIFSGVVTTICRALGIPSRVVSNLVSAHDANASLTVDKYYDENDEELKFDPNNLEGEDSIWNYHVWNEAYMARPDLPPGYGGWQAIDATPQEKSQSFYQCGPASLEAIKQGQVGLNFDVAFMVASINADLMRWKADPSSDFGFSRIYCNKYHIGRMILTKQPFLYDPNGDNDREDITLQYKAKEGSEAERLSLLNAVRCSEIAKRFYELPKKGLEDIEFDLLELERIKIGENFQVIVNIKNNSSETRTIRAMLSTGSVYYTGVKGKLIKKSQGEFKMKPNSNEQLKLTVRADDYLDKLVEYCNLKLYAIASVIETKQTWADEDDFQVLKPNIDIKILPEIPIHAPCLVTLSFVNPLKKELTDCKFRLAGSGLIPNQIIPYKDVNPGELIKLEVEVRPRFNGEQKLIATFTSREMLDVTGSVKVEVYDDN